MLANPDAPNVVLGTALPASVTLFAYPCAPKGPLADYSALTIATNELLIARSVKPILEERFFSSSDIVYDRVKNPHQFGIKRVLTSAEIDSLVDDLQRAVGETESVARVNMAFLKAFRLAGRFNDNTIRGPFRVISLVVLTLTPERAKARAIKEWTNFVAEEQGVDPSTLRPVTPIKHVANDPHDHRYGKDGFWIRSYDLELDGTIRIPYTNPPGFRVPR